MAKKKIPKTNTVWHLSKDEATLAQNPRYNGFSVGHGVHENIKYNRTQTKKDTIKEIELDRKE